MALMDSRESMGAVVKDIVQYIKKGGKEDDYCEDMLRVMLKTSYDRGREDELTGHKNDIQDYKAIYSHTF